MPEPNNQLSHTRRRLRRAAEGLGRLLEDLAGLAVELPEVPEAVLDLEEAPSPGASMAMAIELALDELPALIDKLHSAATATELSLRRAHATRLREIGLEPGREEPETSEAPPGSSRG